MEEFRHAILRENFEICILIAEVDDAHEEVCVY